MTERRQPCADMREPIESLVSGDVSVPDLALVRAHLETCDACDAYRRALKADAEAMTAYAASHGARVEALRLRSLAALPDAPVARRSVVARLARSRVWRTALAASLAAVVFLAVFFGGDGKSIDVWAEVYEAVVRHATGRFRLHDMTGSGIEAEQVYGPGGLAHRTFEAGRVVESLHLDYERRTITYLTTPLQLAVRLEFDDPTMEAYSHRTPDKLFAFLIEGDHEDLGRRRFGLRRLQGVRVTDAEFMAERLDRAELELWVDPDDRLPVRLDVRGEVAGGQRRRHVRFEDFEWNVETSSEDFSPTIPGHFELHTGPRLRLDEQGLVEGLRLFAEVTGDRYPSSLAYESLRMEMWRDLHPSRAQIGPLIVKMFLMRQACQYYGKLVEDDAGVVYFGHRVAPRDRDRVLMRWRTDDGRYRVVYGDLRVDTVDGDVLLRLEG